MIRVLSIVTAIITFLINVGVVPVAAVENRVEIVADRTAQWTNQEKAANYDLRIHGWKDWENAAYIGFTLSDMSIESIKSAKLKLDTKRVSASGTAYLYAAEYNSFENNMQYAGISEAPRYNETEILSFTSPSEAGEMEIDISDYIMSLDSDVKNVAFRIDVKSQNTNNNWVIGSCNNGGGLPKLIIDGEFESTIKNNSFADGTNNWTISNSDNVTVADGKLVATGIDYEARISQTVEGLENGIYTLSAYLTNNTVDGVCYLYAKTEGNTMSSTAVPVCNAEQKVAVTGINVQNGRCDIGLYINGSQGVTLDNLILTRAAEMHTPFLKGGEISKLTYIEDMGGEFYDADGKEGDALQIMAENGFNFARIRVLNNPGKGRGDGKYYLPDGYQTEEDCLALSKRAKDKGMKIVFSFAYSDTWSDGEKQVIPYDWQSYITENKLTGEAMTVYLENQVYEYTKDIMNKLIAQDTCPEFVSIGNEIQVGILFGKYADDNSLYNNPDYLARLVNAGARAVRETAPKSKIILHSDHGGVVLSERQTFVKILSKVDYDVIGVSYYPYYTPEVSIDAVADEFAAMINRYNKDVMIMETGYNWNEAKPDGWNGQLADSGYYQDIYGESQEGQRAFLTELYAKMKQVSQERCIGVLYWDPVMIYDGGSGKIGWAIDEATDSTQANVVPNSTIFDFEGKAVAGQQAMKYNTSGEDNILITGVISNTDGVCANTEITIIADYREYIVTTDRFGEYIVSVPYPETEKLGVAANGFEGSYYVDAPYDGVLVSDIDFPTERKDEIPESGYYIKDLKVVNDKNGEISFSTDYHTNMDNVLMYVAVYNKDGEFIGCRINEKNGSFKVDKNMDGYIVKVFLWDEKMGAKCEPREEKAM